MMVLFPVLDMIVRIIGSVVLLAGVVLLVTLIWGLSQDEQEDPDGAVLVPDGSLSPKQRRAVEMAKGMGFKTRFDYAHFGGDLTERLGHCYMLAGKAILNQASAIPAPVALIHGSWHGPDAESRIDHAVVLLDTGQVWEPVTAGVYDRAMFESYTRWHRRQIFTAVEARYLMSVTGTYGPW